MKPEDYIIKQLKEQFIEFELVQTGYNPSEQSAVSICVKKWTEKFIGNPTAPYLESYLWHVFGNNVTFYLEGNQATEELMKQYPSEVFLFNEPQQYLIRCWGKVPLIEMEDFFDDVYVCHHNMNWTYVIPHESNIGPFFSTGK